MAALIEAAKDPRYPAEICTVVSSDPEAEGLSRAAAEGVPTLAIRRAGFKSKSSFEELLHQQLRVKKVEMICLAGFMHILSADFVAKWQDRILNIHPSLLPAFKGLNTHARALAAGARVHGATVHIVTPDLDAGPIVAQEPVEVLDGDTEASLGARVLEVENRLYPTALRTVLEGQLPRVA